MKENDTNCDDDDNVYNTQPVDEVDTEIYDEIKSQLGQNDKETFIDNLLKKYSDDSDQLNEIRQSMYDYAKSTYEEFPGGYLTERRQRGKNGKTVGEKYATDVYYLFAYCEGIVTSTELQREVMSKYKLKNASTSLRDFDQNSDNVESNEKNSTDSLYSAIMESVRHELIPIQEQLSQIKSAFQVELRSKNHEIRSLRCENDRLQLELSNSNAEKSRLADLEAQSKSEIKFLNQKIKSFDDEYDARTQIMKELKKIQNIQKKQMKQSEMKIQNEREKNKRQALYSDVVNGSSPDHMQINDSNPYNFCDERMDSTISEDETESDTVQLVEANEQTDQNAVNTSLNQDNVVISSVKSSSMLKTHTNMSEAKEVSTSPISETSDTANSSSPADAFTDNGWSRNITRESQSAFTGYTFVRKKDHHRGVLFLRILKLEIQHLKESNQILWTGVERKT